MSDTLHSPEQLRIRFNIASEQGRLPKPLLQRAFTVLNATNTLETNLSVTNANLTRKMQPAVDSHPQEEAVVETNTQDHLSDIRDSISRIRAEK